MRQRTRIVGGIALTVIALTMSACSSSKKTSAPSTSSAASPSSSAPSTSASAATTSAASAAATSAASSGGTYDIGFTDGLTGPTSAYTQPELTWAKAVFNAQNAAGGVNGHMIKLVSLDQGAPGSGQASANVIQLASQDKVSAILGMLISNDCAAAAPVAARYQTPLLCQRAPLSLVTPVNKYLFVDTDIESGEVEPQMALVKKIVHSAAPRVAVFGNDNIGTNNWAGKWQKLAPKNGMTIATYQNMSESATSASANVAAIVASKPDVIVAEIFGQFFQPLVQGLSAAGLHIPIITTSGDIFYSTVQQLNSPDIYQTAVASPLNPDATSSLSADQTKLVTALGAAGASSAADVNGGEGSLNGMGPWMIISALQQCGYPCSGSKMATALESASTNGVGLIPGGFAYTSSSHIGVKSYQFFQWDPTAKAYKLADTEPTGNATDLG